MKNDLKKHTLFRYPSIRLGLNRSKGKSQWSERKIMSLWVPKSCKEFTHQM